MKPLLIVLNSSNPSRVHHLLKFSSLQNQFEVLLVIDDQSSMQTQQKYLPNIIQVQMKNLNEEMPSLVEKIEKYGRPSAIINLSEFMLPLHARLSVTYQLLGPNEEMAEIGRNKNKMREFCHNLEIPIPRSKKITATTLHLAKELNFPIIIKPAMGGGSQLVKRIASWEALDAEFPTLLSAAHKSFRNEAVANKFISESGELPFVAEELIGGTVEFSTDLPYRVGEISVESIYHNGQVEVLAIHDKPLRNNGPYFEEFIWSTPSRISEELQKQAFEYVSRIHKKLGHGAIVLHTEFRTVLDKLVILEFGVRMGGAAIYRSVLHSTGVDMIDVLIAITLGKPVPSSPKFKKPTISHAIWASEAGIVHAVHGEESVKNIDGYIEHLIFDDRGSIVNRAPISTRAHGHLVMQSQKGFQYVEMQLQKALSELWIQIEGQNIKPKEINFI